MKSLLLVLAIVGLARGQGAFTVSVLLNSFSNPDNRTLSGAECNGPDLLGPTCTLELQICVEAYDNRNYTHNATSCASGWKSTGWLASNQQNVTFQSMAQYGDWANPSYFSFFQEYTAVTIKIRAVDKDPMAPWAPQVVDQFIHIVQMTANSNGMVEIQHPRSNGFTTIQPTLTNLWVGVNCTAGSPPFCQGPAPNTTVAPVTFPPANPCAHGGSYYNGYCYCAPGWVGPFCRQSMNSTTTATTPIANHTLPPVHCQHGGSNMGGWCLCPAGWIGSRCQFPVNNGTNTTTATTPFPGNFTTATTPMPPHNTTNGTCCMHGIVFMGRCYCDNHFTGRCCDKPVPNSASYSTQNSDPEEDLIELCEHLLAEGQSQASDKVMRICHPRIQEIVDRIEENQQRLVRLMELC